MNRTKLLAVFVALALMLAAVPAFAATTLASGGGVELWLLKFEVSTIGNPSITLKIRGVNNTDHKVWVDLKDVKVDGVPVVSTTRSIPAHTDTGEDSPLLYSVWGSDIDHGAGAAAITSGKTLEMRINVQDNETNERLINEKVTIDLSAPAGGPTQAPSSSSSGSSSSSKTAPSYTPASYDFKTLKKGSKGQAVRDLQQRLTDLGYLNDKVDGSFGRNTAIAVMSFCSQNGLYIQGEATPEMQRLLYSSSAVYYEEPWIPLVFGPEYKWENPFDPTLDSGRFYIQVVNRGSSRSIRGFELYYYKTDVWGNRYVEPNSGIELTQRVTLQQTVEPGYTIYTQPITILPFSWTYTVWIGIHKIVFDDGEIREVPEDEIQYFGCAIKK